MSSSQRRTVGTVMGALLAAPIIALLAAPVASADDLVSVGPVTLDGFTEGFTYDSDTGAFDNYLVGSYDAYPYDLDIYFDPSGSGDSEVLLTIPLLFQGGFTDVDGTISPVYTFDAADFVNSDVGLVDLGGTPDPALGVVSFGPIDLGGDLDTLSVNTDTYAIDNYLTGTSNAVPFDLDFATGAPGSDSSEFLFTVPALFQVGLDDVDGTITPLFSLGALLDPDIGLSTIGGL